MDVPPITTDFFEPFPHRRELVAHLTAEQVRRHRDGDAVFVVDSRRRLPFAPIQRRPERHTDRDEGPEGPRRLDPSAVIPFGDLTRALRPE